MNMNKKLGLLMIVLGAFLLSTTLALPSMQILTQGDSTNNWAGNAATISISTTYVSPPSSIMWTTNVASSIDHSFITYYATSYNNWVDWTGTPIFTCKWYPTQIPSGLTTYVVLITSQNYGAVEFYYPVSGLVAGQWNTVTVDLRNAISSNPAGFMPPLISEAWAVRLQYGFYPFLTSDFVTYVDDLEVVASSTPPPTTYTLTMTTTPNGTTTPAAGTYTYNSGTSVTLTATPSSGYCFDYWTINSVPVTANPTTITITSIVTITPVMSLITQPPPPPPTNVTSYIVTMLSSVNGTTTPANGAYNYTSGATATFSATPNTDYRFDYWMVNGVQQTSNPLSVTVLENLEVTPVFTLTTEPPPPPPPAEEILSTKLFMQAASVMLMISGVAMAFIHRKRS